MATPTAPSPTDSPPAKPAPRKATNNARLGPIDKKQAGRRIVLYGPGGIGKTTLAAAAPGPVAFIDGDESLPRLREIGDVLVANGVHDWPTLLEFLRGNLDGVRTLVLDSATLAEEWVVAHTLRTVPVSQGVVATNVESYGYGKGYQYVYDTFLGLLSLLNEHSRAGRNVILVCHDCTATVPNPRGEDWQQYQPRLQSPSSGKGSIRLRVKEWADDVLFLGYDVEVGKDGVGRGRGSRTLYASELPAFMAKSRTASGSFPIDDTSGKVWNEFIK